MKTILVEMEKLKNPNSGLGQFCFHLGMELQKFKSRDLNLQYYLPKSKDSIFGEKITVVRQSPIHKFLSMNSDRIDLWHCVHQDSSYLPSSRKTRLLLTIHDLNFLEKYRGIRRALKLGKLQKKIDRACAITVISKYTESMAREHLDLSGRPIFVIPNGNSLIPIPDPQKPTFAHFDQFIFTIGIISRKKNFHTLLPLLEQHPDLHLVIAGDYHSHYANQLIEEAARRKLDSRLHLPGPVNNEQKNWLYQNCKAFVFPSLTEGFGLPVVEAMSLGKPVFLSDRSSLPEIGGPEAFYWNRFEPDHMNRIFDEGLSVFDLERSHRSIQWTKQFSWEKAAQSYLKLYAEL